MSCCKSIGEALKKVLKAIAPILAIALIAFAAYAYFVVGAQALGSVAALSWMPAGMAALSGTTAAYIALGASVLLDPSAAGEVIGDVGEGIGTVITKVIGGVAEGMFGGNFLLFAIGGLALWWFLSKDDEKTTTEVEVKAVPPETSAKSMDGEDERERRYGSNLKEYSYGQ